MLSYLAPILVFGLVIFVHELGHFIAAKALGVYAPRFSIGFGPALLKFRRGETEYILAALPFGGYVRMASRLDEESAFLEGGSEVRPAESEQTLVVWDDPEAMIPFGPKPVPPNRWFESKSLPARVVIMIAGVVMNIVLAFTVYSALELHEGHLIVPTTVIGTVPELSTAPELKRLQTGDTIREVNGQQVHNWVDVFSQMALSGGTLRIKTNRDSASVPLKDSVTLGVILSDLTYYQPAVISMVVPGQAAEAAGFQPGDSVVAIDSLPIRLWADLTQVVGASAGRALRFQVGRPDGIHTLTVTPRATAVTDSLSGKVETLGRIGVGPRSVATQVPVGFVDGVRGGAHQTWRAAGAIYGLLGNLFKGNVSVSQLGGPIAITRMSVSEAKKGIEELFRLIAFLSINIAVLNLLPIPILDGGQIVINVLESAKGSPFSLRTREYILRAGLVVIGLLFVTVMYNDTKGWVMQLFHWVAKSVGKA